MMSPRFGRMLRSSGTRLFARKGSHAVVALRAGGCKRRQCWGKPRPSPFPTRATSLAAPAMESSISSENELEARMEEANAAITAQGGTVRELKDQVKAKKKAKEDVSELDALVAKAVQELLRRKEDLAQMEREFEHLTGIPRNKETFRELVTKVLESRMFVKPSFGIYGGVAGLYDYGPPGTAVKANITQFWRRHFVLHESMLEVECPAVTPQAVLKTSGHVDRFVDFMVKDEAGNCMRADHLLEERLKEIMEDVKASAADKEAARDDLTVVGEMDGPALAAKLKQYKCCSSDPKGGEISEPYPFNLMFRTSIGPRGDAVGFLRPETAQGIFVSFRDLLYYNGGRLPFAAAQIGQSFRNEINPRQGVLRVREFTQAEIEHFVHPERKTHPRFDDVADVAPLMYSVARQQGQGGQRGPQAMALRDAVRDGVVANETLAYFIGRTYLFMTAIGINPRRMMFRQHLPNEMAHYACDCWDCEVQTTYDDVECVGLADRAAFDLSQHAAATKTELAAYEQFDEPQFVEQVEVMPQMKVLGKQLKQAGRLVAEHLKLLSECDALALKERLESDGTAEVSVDGLDTPCTISKDMVTIEKVTKKLSGRTITPSVIEPSFGIGRILYCVFEHTFYRRKEDEQKTVFRFPPFVAPVKATVFPLIQNADMNAVAERISAALRRAGIASIIDTTGVTIGRRYARTDELGVPFALTIDHDTIKGSDSLKDTVTLRERDSTEQVRVPVQDLAELLQTLCEPGAELSWDGVKQKYPMQAPRSDD